MADRSLKREDGGEQQASQVESRRRPGRAEGGLSRVGARERRGESSGQQLRRGFSTIRKESNKEASVSVEESESVVNIGGVPGPPPDLVVFRDYEAVSAANVDDSLGLNVSFVEVSADLVAPVFRAHVDVSPVEDVVSDFSLESVEPVVEVSLPAVKFKSPTPVEVAGDAMVDIRFPERGGVSVDVRLVSPVFARLASSIEPVTLVDDSIPEAVRVTPSGGRGSTRSQEASRVGGLELLKELPEAEGLAGVVNELFEVELYGLEAGWSPGKISLGDLVALERPIVVLAPEYEGFKNYEMLLLLLLREVYRVSAKGLPRPLIISRSPKPDFRFGEVYAERSVGLIDLRRVDEWKGVSGEFRDRILELFSQGYGFLVVYYGSSGEDEALRALYGAMGELALRGIPAHVVRVKCVDPLRVARAIDRIWGFILNSPGSAVNVSVSVYAADAEKRYYQALAKIAGSPLVQLEVPANPDYEGLEGESLAHYALKGVAYLYLKHVLGYRDAAAESGCGVEGVRVDVCAGDVIVEVETLYGRGLPLRRLVDLVESRRAFLEQGRRLLIILPPPQAAILPRRWLEAFKEYVKKKYPGRVALVTIDVGLSLELVRRLEDAAGKGRLEAVSEELKGNAKPLVRIL